MIVTWLDVVKEANLLLQNGGEEKISDPDVQPSDGHKKTAASYTRRYRTETNIDGSVN